MSDEENNTVYLPWMASDFLDKLGYKGNVFIGIVDDNNRIIVGYDGELTVSAAESLVTIANENPKIALQIQKEKIQNGTNPEVLKRILESVSDDIR